MENTEYGVYIIESMSKKDIKANRFPGKMLLQLLNLCDIPAYYYKVGDRDELEKALIAFETSKLRYLHIICHGNDDEFVLTHDSIPFSEFYLNVKSIIKNKRVFISACNTTNSDLAKLLFEGTDCFSVIGTPDTDRSDRAPLFWGSFYHLMFEKNFNQMRNNEIRKNLKNLTSAFEIRLNYYSFKMNNRKRIKNYFYSSGKESYKKLL